MKVEVFWADRSKRNPLEFLRFVQRMANRLLVGHHRYGDTTRRQQYYLRLRKELDKYDETGNAEHLVNIANYALLENEKPSNPKYHYDPGVKSATRGKFGV